LAIDRRQRQLEALDGAKLDGDAQGPHRERRGANEEEQTNERLDRSAFAGERAVDGAALVGVLHDQHVEREAGHAAPHDRAA
jgi:hypothetical protein